MDSTIGLRRENKSAWEKRAAFTPEHVAELVVRGIHVLVQPSEFRCFSDAEYSKAGAELVEDLSRAKVIFGIKEVDPGLILPERTYVFFSHTLKAQPYNMQLLDTIRQKHAQLIDYEVIKDKQPPYGRLVAFGKFAGNAGMLDFLHGLGKFLLLRKISSPFIYQGLSYTYPWMADAMEPLARVGQLILNEGLAGVLVPLVFGIVGTGRVARGAQEILEQLPHQYLSPAELLTFEFPADADKRVYIVVFGIQCVYARKERGEFSRGEYMEHPERYRSVFGEKYMRRLSVVVQAIYWDRNTPVNVTESELLEDSGRLLGICDISCDLRGGIEVCRKYTTPEQPFYLFNTHDNRIYELCERHVGQSLLMHSMDFLPAEVARDSTMHFGDCLMRFVKRLAEADYSQDPDKQGLDPEIEGAVVVHRGQLTEQFRYIDELRVASVSPTDPIIELLSKCPDLVSDIEQAKHGQELSADSKAAVCKLAALLSSN